MQNFFFLPSRFSLSGVNQTADLIQETRGAIEQAQRLEQQKSGECLSSPYASYTHNIGIDNLNVYRVHWPVAWKKITGEMTKEAKWREERKRRKSPREIYLHQQKEDEK